MELFHPCKESTDLKRLRIPNVEEGFTLELVSIATL